MACPLKIHKNKKFRKPKDPRYLETMVTCPLVHKPICLWCCLHIHDLSEQDTRINAQEKNPEYNEFILDDTFIGFSHDWNEVHKVCGACRAR